jgi:hypothetical protein
VAPDDSGGGPDGGPPRDPTETRRVQARLFLAAAVLFLFSAVRQWAAADETSDRVWSAVLALIALGVGLYFWRVLRELRRPPAPGPESDEAPGR